MRDETRLARPAQLSYVPLSESSDGRRGEGCRTGNKRDKNADRRTEGGRATKAAFHSRSQAVASDAFLQVIAGKPADKEGPRASGRRVLPTGEKEGRNR
jgi:hypothetical protein